MKKILFIALFAILTFSCHQSELEYSCDPAINKFVIENLQELSTVSVQKLGSYDFQLQKAIFTSWDYQKKRNAWIEKLQYILIHIPFTELEKFHIQSLIDHITDEYFLKENLDNSSEIRSQFAYQWISYSKSKLGWSNQFIAFVVYRLYTEQSQFDSELSFLKSISKVSSADSEGDCNCNVSSDFCGNVDCKSGGCAITSGCGWLWSMSCNGECY